jgi:hypothetical protein
VLLSSVGFALLAWVHQNQDAAFRLRSFYAEQEARRVALDWIRTINPMEQPKGEISHGALRIVWEATPLSPPIAQIGYPQGIGRHEVALYATKFSVFRPGEFEPWFTEELKTIGHHGVATKVTPFS